MRKSTLLKTYLIISFFAISLTGFGQVKIGTNPTTIESTSNLEVEASTTGRKLKVDKTSGQLTVADGTQGTGKVLTSDAQGGASWQTPSQLQIDKTVFVGRQSSQKYTITNWNNVFNAVKDRIPLVSVLGSSPGYDSNTKQYTIQESGNYRIFAGAALNGTSAPPQTTVATVCLFPFRTLNTYDGINNVVGPVLSVVWDGYLAAGELVSVTVTSVSSIPGGSTQEVEVDKGYLTIVKLAY
ncbi:hypothetical protein DSL64_08420 [Dyadobacter luteus]|uniref:Uncharacterized protein n=1 Tax=Dyadobacter luteus TaxID=2259619 RepID=A0A3D8YEH3_9BACT|nr:hypothetical protein [Dyadobacter luteus]REA62924.1 hypothetical protein DSL64_08420 [Dyadobacter luteus]